MLTWNLSNRSSDYFIAFSPRLSLLMKKKVDCMLAFLATHDYFPLLIMFHFFSSFTKAGIEFDERRRRERLSIKSGFWGSLRRLGRGWETRQCGEPFTDKGGRTLTFDWTRSSEKKKVYWHPVESWERKLIWKYELSFKGVFAHLLCC